MTFVFPTTNLRNIDERPTFRVCRAREKHWKFFKQKRHKREAFPNRIFLLDARIKCKLSRHFNRLQFRAAKRFAH